MAHRTSKRLYQRGCTLAILISFAYLLIRKVISPRFIFTVASTVVLSYCSLVKGREMDFSGMVNFALGNLLTGGLMSGAVFMATDYTTSPITKTVRLFYAILIGFFNCNIQSPRLKRRRCILRYYYFEPCCSSY